MSVLILSGTVHIYTCLSTVSEGAMFHDKPAFCVHNQDLKRFYQKKKRKLRQKFSSGVPRVGVEELLASRFDDGRRTLERPLRLGGAFDRCGMCTALLLRSAHHLCKYDGMPRLKTRFVESNGVLGLPVVFFLRLLSEFFALDWRDGTATHVSADCLAEKTEGAPKFRSFG